MIREIGGFCMAALLALACIVCAGLPVCAAETQGAPYVTTVAALKLSAPEQRLSVEACGYTFEKTIAELGSMEVLAQDGADGSRLVYIPDTSLLDAFAEEINTALELVPVGDGFLYYDTETASFRNYPAASYYQINEAGKEQIYFKLLEMLSSDAAEDGAIKLGEDYLELDTHEIPEEVAVWKYSLEGSCTTSFQGSSANRIQNIQVASSNINRLILYPGCEVSMNEAFLPRTYENGYREAGAYSNGKVISATGGGICQVSSTVYNAAMNSGLTILERHPHSMPVHYLPLAMDAAISSGSKDLRIRNDYPFPVLFEAYTEGKNLTVNIYTNELLTAGTSYRLHSVSRGSLAADAYLEISVDGTVVEDRFIGTSRYSPMRSEEEEPED